MRLKWIIILVLAMFVISFVCNKHEEKTQMEYEVVTVTDTVYVDSLCRTLVDTVVVE